jgi:hypothetical protein
LNDQVKKDELYRTCSTNGENRNTYRIFVGKPEGNRSLKWPRRRWENDIEMDLRKIAWDGVHRICLRIGTNGGLTKTR